MIQNINPSHMKTPQAATYVMNNSEYNLATMIKETVIRAFVTYPMETTEQIAVRLGISERSAYRYMKQFNISRKTVKVKEIQVTESY